MTAVFTTINVIFVIGYKAADSSAHAEIDEVEVAVNLNSQCPKAKLFLVKIVERQRNAG